MGNEGWFVNLDMSMPGNPYLWQASAFAAHQCKDLLPHRVTWPGCGTETSIGLFKHGIKYLLCFCAFLNSRELVFYTRCERSGWPSELVSQHAITPTVPPPKIWSITCKCDYETPRQGNSQHQVLYMLYWYKDENIRNVKLQLKLYLTSHPSGWKFIPILTNWLQGKKAITPSHVSEDDLKDLFHSQTSLNNRYIYVANLLNAWNPNEF